MEFCLRSNPNEKVTVGHIDENCVETITPDGLHLWSTRLRFDADFVPVDSGQCGESR